MSDPNEPAFPPPDRPPPPYRSPQQSPQQPPPPYQAPAPAGWGAPPPGYGAYGPPPPPPYPTPKPRRSKVLLVLAIVVALIAVGLGVTLPLVLGGDDNPANPATAEAGSSSGSGITGPEPGDDLSTVQEYDDLARDHVTDPVDYPQTPPVGGPHHPSWAECGVYDAPLPDEVATHDLEHGTFWFTYDADSLDADQVAALADQLPDNAIMSPYEGLGAPVVVTVWGRQLALTGPDDPRLALFLEEYAGGTTAPEPFASCAGGLSGADLDQVAGELAGTGPA